MRMRRLCAIASRRPCKHAATHRAGRSRQRTSPRRGMFPRLRLVYGIATWSPGSDAAKHACYERLRRSPCGIKERSFLRANRPVWYNYDGIEGVLRLPSSAHSGSSRWSEEHPLSTVCFKATRGFTTGRLLSCASLARGSHYPFLPRPTVAPNEPQHGSLATRARINWRSWRKAP